MNSAFLDNSHPKDVEMSSPTGGLLSPSPSVTSTRSSSNLLSLSNRLPQSRSHPLKPGSQKEIRLINFIDSKLLRITRRYAKKFSNNTDDADTTKGYMSFNEVSEDLDAILDVVWISGTPTLQVPYLLTLAGLFCSYMPAFPFSGEINMFRLVRKLDECFLCLLKSQLGAEYHVTTTDRVRIKSLIEETRVVAVEVASESGQLMGNEDESEEDSEDVEEELSDQMSMSLSRIYKRTVELLGDSLVEGLS